VLFSLERAGWPSSIANAIGFVLSAQLNFVLSSTVTWGDRPAVTRRRLVGRWASYQMTTLLALTVNVMVFAVAMPVTGSLLAAFAGVAIGTVVTFAVNHFLVFRPVPVEVTA
jgi:putative flippase GtrA